MELEDDEVYADIDNYQHDNEATQSDKEIELKAEKDNKHTYVDDDDCEDDNDDDDCEDDDNDDAGRFSLVHMTSKKKTPLPIFSSTFWTSSIENYDQLFFDPRVPIVSSLGASASGTAEENTPFRAGKPIESSFTNDDEEIVSLQVQSILRGSGGKPKNMVEPPTCQPRDDNSNITSITPVVTLNEQECSQGSGGNPKLLALTLPTPPHPLTTTSKVQVQPLSITTHVEDLPPPSPVTLQLSNVLVDLEKTYVYQSPQSSMTTTQSKLTTTTSRTQLTTSLIQSVFNDLPFAESKKLMVAQMTNQLEFQEKNYSTDVLCKQTDDDHDPDNPEGENVKR
ncbi:hypothetical protein Tco_0355802 [Tanacetum coccineum]